ncbi:MAG: UDP-N-acetylglucosamine 1-carboxyvinyltransferase [Anaerovorax sp.]|nr:UDP-N-acetylglucosamine 1-carboxyvinyltransferase [Anaerovorax sp.]
MDSYHIIGGNRIFGSHKLTGAKNGVLPILAASLVTGDVCTIHNCPDLLDVNTMLAILKELGCKIQREKDAIIVDSSQLTQTYIPKVLGKEMRSSVFLLGPMLTRCGVVEMSQPGGCAIGARPIDLHLDALRKMGAEIKEEDGHLVCKSNGLKGTTIRLDFPSVGATENIMMAALSAEGETHIVHPAKEPEIEDLQNFLNSCGGCIEGAGTGEIVISGKKPLHGTDYKVIPDRIEAGTFLAAAAATKGELLLENAAPAQMASTLAKFREMGCSLKIEQDKIYLKGPDRLKAIREIKTLPYPGFPTDMQSQFLTLMTLADGRSKMTETIFENRFKHIDSLRDMGAIIELDGCSAKVTGVEQLQGCRVEAKDLRGGAAMVIAGLAASDETIVENICHIDRGYDKFEVALKNLGTKIERIQEDERK